MKKRIAKIVKPCCQCKQCQTICPIQAIFLENNTYEIHPELCSGCGLCASTCPQQNIILIEWSSENMTHSHQTSTYLKAHKLATYQEKQQFIAEAVIRVNAKRKNPGGSQ